MSTTKNVVRKSLLETVYHVYVVTNTKTGGKYVSVRKNISKNAFWSLICVGARNENFDQPIHQSVREMGDENSYLEDSHHTITLVQTFRKKVDAQELAGKMIEQNAVKAIALNATRPAAGASETFTWFSPETTEQVVKAKAKARRAAKARAKVSTTEQVAA